MPTPETYSFPRYLAAKRSVDERALNRTVWEALRRGLSPASAAAPLHALEIGAGTGAMFERMLGWGLLQEADYTAVDLDAESIACARQQLPHWAVQQGYQVEICLDSSLSFSRTGQRVRLELVAQDVFDFIAGHQDQPGWDLLIAHAFLDLIDIPTSLPLLFRLCKPGGLFYFTINFDGLTLFEPAIDPAFDELVQTLYHRTMDERRVKGKPSGDSRAGRHLFQHLREAGAEIIAAGASDWVVIPGAQGYPQDEAYFLHFIVHTVHQALAGQSELEARRFEGWIAERHAQIERSELVYIAHQLDYAGRVPSR
jgi:SAM-dependent methyltransferase